MIYYLNEGKKFSSNSMRYKIYIELIDLPSAACSTNFMLCKTGVQEISYIEFERKFLTQFYVENAKTLLDVEAPDRCNTVEQANMVQQGGSTLINDPVMCMPATI